MIANEGYIAVEDGVRLFFQKVGRGSKTLIVLNGFYLSNDFAHLTEGRRVIFLDLRNRGRSDYITADSKLTRGIFNDVEDLEIVRAHLGAEQVELLAHSYATKAAMLYARKYGAHVSRVVLIGAMKPDENTQYPAHLTNVDPTLREFFEKTLELQRQRASLAPQEFCKRFWSLLRVIYVAKPEDADKIHWDCCDLPTELNLMTYWVQHLFPSIQRAGLTARDLVSVKIPVLIVHGTKDRSSPYGAAREWAMVLPNARLLALEDVAHAPWIEAPERVLGPIQTFLDGSWPNTAELVVSL